MSDNFDSVSTLSFSPIMSSDEICLGDDVTMCLTDAVNSKASANHTHTGYASAEDLTTLTDVVATHTHTEYALSSHYHLDYAMQDDINIIYEELENKANSSHTHTEYASSSHTHSEYAPTTHNHDEDYAPLSHTHNDYATTTSLNELATAVSGKANTSHNHDDVYYTETEVDIKLASKADSSHAHTGIYDASGSAANALTTANAYTDSKIDALVGTGASTTLDTIGEISAAIENNQDAIDLLNSAIGNKANSSDLISHTGDTTVHVTSTEKAAWNAKSDFSGNYNDLTNKPTIPSISGLATETYVDEAISVKANSSHIHAISDVTNLQTALNAKATQASLDTHVADMTTHVTSTERTNWNTAKTHADSAHAPSNAQANQNAFSYVKVGDTSVAADNTTDTLTLVAGSNVTITSDTNSDSITISATDTNTIYSAGTGISLSGTTFNNAGVRSISTGTTNGTISVNTNGTTTSVPVYGLGSAAYTASTAYDASGAASSALASAKTYADSVGVSVKNELLNGAGTAYDTLKELGDLIDDNADAIDALETIAAGKANASHTHAISDVPNLQSTLDGKAAFSHGTHVSYSTTTPVMDGTASTGTASTVARSDHKHPTDTSRASQTDLDALETVVAGKANTSHTHTIANVTNLQTSLDNKQATITGGASTITSSNLITSRALISNSAGKVAVSDVTSTELGYLDGVTSNVQTQLDGKAATSHSHSASNITSGTLSPDRFPTVPISKGGTGATTATTALTNLGITATSTELNYVDGVTSNIQTQLNGKSSTSHTHSYAGSSSVGGAATSANKLNTNAGDYNTPVYFANGVPVACTSLDLNTTGSSASCTGNASTATKLATARTIGLSTGATGTATSFNGSTNISIPVTDVKEAYLSWGGKALSGSVSPIDAASSNLHSANRFAFAKANGITIEYSTDGGSTYSTYDTTDSAKINLVSGVGSSYYIGARSTSTTVNDKLRITLNATNMGLYTRLRKILINISTGYAIGSNVIVEKAMKGSESTYTTIGTYSISGWSGWNSIPIGVSFGGSSSQTSNIANLRLTFGITGVNSNQTSNALTIIDIIGIGDTYWAHPSSMAKNGHLYTYDASQNATFPAKVTASSFNGATFSGGGVATVSEVKTYLGI